MKKFRCRLKFGERPCVVKFNKGGIMMACYRCRHQYELKKKGG